MDPNTVIDDIWMVIFDDVDHATLAQLSLVCHRFRDLATKPLLREVRWRDPQRALANMASWERSYSDLLAIPRKLVFGLPFRFTGFNSWANPEDMFLYDRSISHLRRFTTLRDIHFTKTALTPHLYDILRQIPTLHSLTITDCGFSPIYTTFRDMVYWRYGVALNHQDNSDFPWSEIPIRHLSLHRITMQPENDYSHFNPLHLITSSTLESLDITWSQGFSNLYTLRRWTLPHLTTLNVTVPLHTREQTQSLMLLSRRCSMNPRTKLTLWRQNLTDQQLHGMNLQLTGVWHYKGPLCMAGFGETGATTTTTTLSHVVMNEAMDSPGVLDGLRGLPDGVKHLEVRLRRWDIEVLYAIRFLFPKIRSFVVRYGKGNLPQDLFVTIGSDILFELSQLRAFKLLADPSCMTRGSPDSSPTGNNTGGGGGGGGNGGNGGGGGGHWSQGWNPGPGSGGGPGYSGGGNIGPSGGSTSPLGFISPPPASPTQMNHIRRQFQASRTTNFPYPSLSHPPPTSTSNPPTPTPNPFSTSSSYASTSMIANPPLLSNHRSSRDIDSYLAQSESLYEDEDDDEAYEAAYDSFRNARLRSTAPRDRALKKRPKDNADDDGDGGDEGGDTSVQTSGVVEPRRGVVVISDDEDIAATPHSSSREGSGVVSTSTSPNTRDLARARMERMHAPRRGATRSTRVRGGAARANANASGSGSAGGSVAMGGSSASGLLPSGPITVQVRRPMGTSSSISATVASNRNSSNGRPANNTNGDRTMDFAFQGLHSSSSSHFQSHFPPPSDAYPYSSSHPYQPNPPHSHPPHSSHTYHNPYTHSIAHHIPPNTHPQAHTNTSPPTLTVSSRTPDSNESSYSELAFQLQLCHDEFERIQDVQEQRVEEVRRAREEEELRQREERQREEEWLALRSAVDVDEDSDAREERAAFLRAMSDRGSSAGGMEGVVVGKGKGKAKAKAKDEDVEKDELKGKGKGKQRASTPDDDEVTVTPTQHNGRMHESIVSMLDEDEIEADHVASLVVDMVNREAELEDAAMDVDVSEEGIHVSSWLQRTRSDLSPPFDTEMDDIMPPSWMGTRAGDNDNFPERPQSDEARRGEPQPGDLTYGTQFTLSPYAQALMNRGPRSSLGGLDRVRERGEASSKEKRKPKPSLSDSAKKEVFISLRRPRMTHAGQVSTSSFTPRNSNTVITAPINTIHVPPPTSSDPAPYMDDDESDEPTSSPSADTQMGHARISLDDFVLRIKNRKSTARGEASPSSNTNADATSSANPTGSTPWQLDTDSSTISLNRYIAHLTSPTSTSSTSLGTNSITSNTILPFNFAAPEPPLTFPQYTQPTPSYTTHTPEDEHLHTEDLQDYLFGWNRFCRNLRYVEIGVEGGGSTGVGASEDDDAGDAGGGGGGAGKDGAAKDGRKNQGWTRRFEGDGWEFGRNWDGWDE